MLPCKKEEVFFLSNNFSATHMLLSMEIHLHLFTRITYVHVEHCVAHDEAPAPLFIPVKGYGYTTSAPEETPASVCEPFIVDNALAVYIPASDW